MTTFGTTDYPSSNVTVDSGGTIAVSAAFENTIGIVGGMDTENGSANTGETIRVSSSGATNQFGEDSELKDAVDLAASNGANTIYACPVPETETTESISATTSGTLDNVPIFDPNVHDEHELSGTDTSESAELTFNVVYESPPSTPTEDNTINVNPNTGEFEADESSDYDITYTYGDYDTAIADLTKKVPRTVAVGTESITTANTLLTTLNTYAQTFGFMHGFVGAEPDLTPADYSNTLDDRRISVVGPSRGYTDAANTNMVRTVNAVAATQSAKPLGESTTADSISGIVDIYQDFSGDFKKLTDVQVLPLRKSGNIEIVKDMTSSTDVKFERIYASEVTDEASEISNRISSQFIGEPNTGTNRNLLAESHDSSYAEMQRDNILDAYQIDIVEGADPNTLDLDIALDIVDVIDFITVDITVGDIVENGGAS
jgi:hypothetical protein